MNWLDRSISDLHAGLLAGEVTPLMLVKEAIRRAKEDPNNAFEYIMEKEALALAAKLTTPENDDLLWGIPFAIKDNFSTKDVPTTASSDILKGYVPLYDATAVARLLQSKAIPIGKTTLDELAMGGTGTSGHLGTTYNPHDPTRTHLVGGSSAGSAAAVAAGIVPFALASDTGDSIRKPASFAGLVGLKPTWGRVSRHGLFAFAPSLDAVGCFTRSVSDQAIVLQAIAGSDKNDVTSSLRPVPSYVDHLNASLKGRRIAIIKGILSAISDQEVLSTFEVTVKALQEKGAIIDLVDLDKDLLASLFPTYFIISCAEATSNNANLDGIRFGPRPAGTTYREVMRKARTAGFGELIKRRFVIGSFALMKENREDLFLRAQKNRRRIVEKVDQILSDHDFIYVPAAPSIAPTFDAAGDRLSDEYLIADNHLVLANFAGLPSITVPIGLKDGLPFGANLTGHPFAEAELLNAAKVLEDITGLKGLLAKRRPA